MSKLSSLAKVHTYKIVFPEEPSVAFTDGFIEGFEVAFKTINKELQHKINQLEQYPVMGERIFAVKTYMKEMEKLLEDMKSNEY